MRPQFITHARQHSGDWTETWTQSNPLERIVGTWIVSPNLCDFLDSLLCCMCICPLSTIYRLLFQFSAKSSALFWNIRQLFYIVSCSNSRLSQIHHTVFRFKTSDRLPTCTSTYKMPSSLRNGEATCAHFKDSPLPLKSDPDRCELCASWADGLSSGGGVV